MKKKIFVFLFLFVMCFLLISCENKPSVYTITFVNEKDTADTIKTGETGTSVSVNVKEVEGYTFDGWYNGEIKIEMPYTIENSDMTFTAKYTIKTFKINFINDDDSIIETQNVNYGEKPVAPNNPSKSDSDKYTFTFKSWDKEIENAYSDTTYKAIYDETLRTYSYTFYLDDEKTVLKQGTVEYGTIPVAPENPTKASDDTYDYIFDGWDKEVKGIKADTVYVACFKATLKQTKYTEIEGLKFSILGDSISTFYVEGSKYNSYYSTSGTYYYPTYCSSVDTWDKTWWGHLMNNSKMTLGINNSWSGSRAAGTTGSAGCTDGRINTLNENGTPDILLVYLGTNDCAGGEETSIFVDAIQTIITKAKALGINQIYLTTLGYSAYTGSSYKDSTRLEYNEELRKLAKSNDCGIVPLDEYITEESYSFYLNDFLHYNTKGAALLAQIYEKSILEYNGLTYTKEITVETKEQLPEGVLGVITATANSNFWGGYKSNVYLFDSTTTTNPQYALRIEITKNATDGKYYVSNIIKSGVEKSYTGDYILCISDAHTEANALKTSLEKVTVGSLVEFDLTMTFPLEITFKESTNGEGGNTQESVKVIDENGIIHVTNYNKNVFGLYETELFIYATNSAALGSNSYNNFNAIGFVKDGENYKIVSMKDAGIKYNSVSDANGATFILFIYSTSEAKPFYERCKVGDYIKITGNIEDGDCKLELVK